MKTIFSVFLGTLISLAGLSQDTYFSVSGKVVDEKTKLPMPNASVFCQNTTVGTITNAEGNFSLRLKNGGYDLIISYTGYQTKSQRISNGNSENDNLNVELQEQDKSLTEVVVAGSAEVADGWSKYGQFFFDNFIGTTPNASQCSIENKDVLKFYFYKKRNKLKIKAATDVIVDNNSLGYKIKYQLDSFVYDYSTKISIYTGYPLFEEMKGTPEQMETWNKNRFATYIGSRLHFMRSWYDSTLTEEGFSLELLDSHNTPTQLENPYDTQIYATDSGDVIVNIKGRLRVNYNNHAPDRKYLVQNNFSLTTPQQISALDIIDGFTIEENGYFYEQSEVTNMGYWAWKKLAEALPYDYNPE
jgi:hypothetical protein